MGWEAVAALAIVTLVFVGLARNGASDALILGGALACAMLGILSPEELFAGFANQGMLMVAGLFVITAALRETGALDILGRALLGNSQTENAVLGRMAIAVTGVSAFLNNTPVVAMFMPVVAGWARKHQVSVSRLLMPLSFFSILGGTCTLIGTSTNLVVNGLMIEHYQEDPVRHAALAPMGFLEIGWVGIPYAIVGVIYLMTLGKHLLPDRKDFLERVGESIREYLANMRMQPGCPLIGRTVAQAGLRNLQGLYLVEILRDGETIAPVSPDQVLQEADVLTFTGLVNHIVELEKIKGLTPVVEEDEEAMDRRAGMLVEAVVSNTSPIIGQSVRESNFRALYSAGIIAVHRGGGRLKGRIGDIVLRHGDTLLLQAGPQFIQAHRHNPDFFLVSGVEDSRPVLHERAWLAIGLVGLLILLLVAGENFFSLPPVLAVFAVAALMVATRCISLAEARQSIELQTLITIAAAFGLGTALVNSGVVGTVAEFAVAEGVRLPGFWGAVAVMAGIYVLTSVITELVTNNAAAALMFPFAVAVAEQLDVSARPFAFTIALAASSSFVTPIGYTTNLMIYAPGGYRFMDFMRVGLPLKLMLFVVAVVLVPLVWPF